MTPQDQMPDISPDMRDFLELLIKHGVQFALCGGFAVTYYGFIRTTMDIDIRSLLQAKKEAGRPKDRIDYEELTALAE